MRTDTEPDLERLEEGQEVTVYYVSERSGNEVDRSGVVASAFDTDDGDRLVRVHTEQKGPFKHQYVAMVSVEREDGEEIVGAWSMTAEADGPDDDPPKIGTLYSYQFTTSRTSLLGRVDRVVREDHGAGPMLMTDGGVDVAEGQP